MENEASERSHMDTYGTLTILSRILSLEKCGIHVLVLWKIHFLSMLKVPMFEGYFDPQTFQNQPSSTLPAAWSSCPQAADFVP